MIPFRGAGGLTILIGMVAVILQFIIPSMLWLLVAAAVNFPLGWFLNRSMRQANIAPENQHSVAEIPMQWWSVLFVVAQIVFLAL